MAADSLNDHLHALGLSAYSINDVLYNLGSYLDATFEQIGTPGTSNLFAIDKTAAQLNGSTDPSGRYTYYTQGINPFKTQSGYLRQDGTYNKRTIRNASIPERLSSLPRSCIVQY